MKNERKYNYLGIIYEDDENFDNQLFNLAQEKEACWIRHDQDVKEDGELKKPHYHFVIKLKNPCTLSALAKRLDVNENMLEYVKNVNSSLKYLIHYGDDNKFQYEPKEVDSNSDSFKNRFLDLVTKDIKESDKVLSIYEFINGVKKPINVNMLFKYVQKHNLWDAYRRNYAIIKDLTYQHNGEILGKRYNNCDDFFSDDIDIP